MISAFGVHFEIRVSRLPSYLPCLLPCISSSDRPRARGAAIGRSARHAVPWTRVLYPSNYGGRSRRTRLLEDQLGRADAGSWQIADRTTTVSA